MNLFGVPLREIAPSSEQVSPEDVHVLREVPLQIRSWLAWIYHRGLLEDAARYLLQAGAIGSPKEAPAFLASEVANRLGGREPISFGDLQRLDHAGLRHFLNRQLGVKIEDNSQTPLFQAMGRVSHRMCEWLYGGRVEICSPHQASLLSVFSGEQISLFAKEPTKARKPEARRHEDLLFEPTSCPVERNHRRIDRALLSELDRALEAVQPVTGSLAAYAAGAFRYEREVARLWQVMNLFFPEQIHQLKRHHGPLAEALGFVSLIGWAKIFLRRLAEDGVPSLTELPVLPTRRTHEVMAGRIDRLDVSVRGRRISVNRERIGSALHLVDRLRIGFSDVLCHLVDWKFAVGDAHDQVIRREDLPISRHIDQVQWYLMWLTLWNEISQGKTGADLANEQFTGSLAYILADGEIVDVTVPAAPEDLRGRFRENVIRHWYDIQDKHDRRILNRLAVAALKSTTGNGSPEAKTGNGGINGNGHTENGGNGGAQGSLFSQTELIHAPVAELVSSFQEFADSARIVEVVYDAAGKFHYRMHLDRLAAALESGEVQTGRREFDWSRGGTVTCPVHREETPSCHVDLRRGYFKCHGIGCGVGGWFVSVPHDLVGLVGSERISRRFVRGADELMEKLVAVPGENRKLAELLQELLHAGFRRSEAERYLALARRIDPDLAYEFGAGCGVDPNHGITVVAELIRAGYTVAQLAEFGVLNFSELAKPAGPVPLLLRRLGVSESEISRKRMLRPRLKAEGAPAQTREITEWVFCPFVGRLTFPLEIPVGNTPVLTSIYCRRIPHESEWGGPMSEGGKKIKSRRLDHLTITIGDVPKGMFNGRGVANEVAEGGLDRIYLTEAVIDALVLRQIGVYPAGAIVGTDTDHLWKVLVGLNPSSLELALDFDQAGVEGTAKIIKKLKTLKFENVSDFCEGFLANHPEVRQMGHDDFGTWWREYGADRFSFKYEATPF